MQLRQSVLAGSPDAVIGPRGPLENIQAPTQGRTPGPQGEEFRIHKEKNCTDLNAPVAQSRGHNAGFKAHWSPPERASEPSRYSESRTSRVSGISRMNSPLQ